MRTLSPDDRLDEEYARAEAEDAATRELIQMVLEGASDDELIRYIQSKAPEVIGQEVDIQGARLILEPIQARIRVILLVREFIQDNVRYRGEDHPQYRERRESRERTDQPQPGLLERLGFAIGSVTLAARFKMITACPHLASTFLNKHQSVLDGKEISIVDVLTSLGHPDELASHVVHTIEHIRAERKFDPIYLADDESMEALRRVLYLINTLKIPNRMFCSFGKEILRDLRTYVADYEREMK